MKIIPSSTVLIATCMLAFTGSAFAQQSATATFDVGLVVDDECTISATDLTFPQSGGVITAAITAEATLTVQCTAGLDVDVGLGAGGGTVIARTMTGVIPTNTVNYNLYTDDAYTSVWGETQGTDTQTATGAAGAEIELTVYGQVSAPQNVAADEYSDAITATVWYASAE